MRKAFFAGVLAILCIIFFLIVSFGFKLGPIKLMSYDEVENANINKKILLSELDDKSKNEYKYKETELKKAIQKYKDNKSNYDYMVASGQIDEEILNNYINMYEFDSLWSIIENYSKEKNVVLKFDVVKSSETASISSKYNMCDLKFKVNGEYINITDFIYILEDDDRLSFEISNLELKQVDGKLEASFTVKNVPILNKSL